jgi:hypothetical protein
MSAETSKEITSELRPAKIAAAFVKAQSQFHAALKDSVNPHFKSKYADLSSVIDAVKDALAKNDLAFMQPLTSDDIGFMITTVLIHASGESISVGTMRVPVLPQDLLNAQKVGASITYARRYHLASAFGISQEDDDGNSASGNPTQQSRPVMAPANTPPSVRQLEYIKSIANDLNIQIPQVKTSHEAAQVIDRLMKQKAAGGRVG